MVRGVETPMETHPTWKDLQQLLTLLDLTVSPDGSVGGIDLLTSTLASRFILGVYKFG